jgi:hypothetical protein
VITTMCKLSMLHSQAGYHATVLHLRMQTCPAQVSGAELLNDTHRTSSAPLAGAVTLGRSGQTIRHIVLIHAARTAQ